MEGGWAEGVACETSVVWESGEEVFQARRNWKDVDSKVEEGGVMVRWRAG